jgi:hypothetical protein
MAQDLKARLIDPANTGGLPVFNDDIIQAQDNNRNTTNEQLEFLRSNINNNTGKLTFPSDTIGGRDDWPVGLILSGCVIDKTVASPYPISEGYVYIDGEVLKFPAGTSITSNQYVQLTKGTEVIAQRTFKDGSTKDATVKHTLDVVVSSRSFGPIPGVPTTTQIIILDEQFSTFQTIQAGLGLITQNPTNETLKNGILYHYNNPDFTAATLESYTTGVIKSRVKELYTNEVIINATVDTTTFVDGTQEYTIGTLNNWSADAEVNATAVISAGATGAQQDQISLIRVLTNGTVLLRKPVGQSTWPLVASSAIYTINASMFTVSSVTTPYTGFNTNFMVKS